MLHHPRGGCFGIKQARNSKLEIQQAMQYLMTWLQKSASGLYPHGLDLGAFGAESQQPIWLYSDQEVQNIVVRLSRAEASAMCPEQPLMVQYVDRDGNTKCHGGPGLKTSQAYPERFGQALCSWWLENRGACEAKGCSAKWQPCGPALTCLPRT